MKLLRVLTLVTVLGLPLFVRAADYPTHPVKITVPYAAGGTIDIAGRIIGQALSQKWGQSVIVENKPGGNGFIGTGSAARATPDGYSLLVAHNGEFSVNPLLFKSIPYDLDRDFVPISLIMDTPLTLVTSAKSGLTSVADVVRQSKAKPGSVNVATPGAGSYNHLAAEWFANAAGIKLTQIPYKGGSPATTAVVAGEAQLGVLGISVITPLVKSGHLKVLAVLTETRLPSYPDWSAISEFGINDVHAANWVGVFAPKSTPSAIIAKLQRDVQEVVKSPAVEKQFDELGAAALGLDAAAFRKRIEQELVLNKVIIDRADIRIEN